MIKSRLSWGLQVDCGSLFLLQHVAHYTKKQHLCLLHTAILFSACFHTAKQISNNIIDAISFQEHYTKAKNEKPTSECTALLGSD